MSKHPAWIFPLMILGPIHRTLLRSTEDPDHLRYSQQRRRRTMTHVLARSCRILFSHGVQMEPRVAQRLRLPPANMQKSKRATTERQGGGFGMALCLRSRRFRRKWKQRWQRRSFRTAFVSSSVTASLRTPSLELRCAGVHSSLVQVGVPHRSFL